MAFLSIDIDNVLAVGRNFRQANIAVVGEPGYINFLKWDCGLSNWSNFLYLAVHALIGVQSHFSNPRIMSRVI